MVMIIDILTLFPAMFEGPFSESLIKKAGEKNLIKINVHNLRKWTNDSRRTVDDRPYAGGPGMVMMVKPVDEALKELRRKNSKVILLTPQGQVFNQKTAQKFSRLEHLILICGHYEGVDERIRKYLVDEEISIGDYVLTGGELPAMILVDTVARLIPGVVGKEASLEEESFSKGRLEYPQYTRPENYRGWKVPEILLSGDHKKIEKWRKNESLKRTKERRPDLLR